MFQFQSELHTFTDMKVTRHCPLVLLVKVRLKTRERFGRRRRLSEGKGRLETCSREKMMSNFMLGGLHDQCAVQLSITHANSPKFYTQPFPTAQ